MDIKKFKTCTVHKISKYFDELNIGVCAFKMMYLNFAKHAFSSSN